MSDEPLDEFADIEGCELIPFDCLDRFTVMQLLEPDPEFFPDDDTERSN